MFINPHNRLYNNEINDFSFNPSLKLESLNQNALSFSPTSEAWEVPFEEISDLQWVGSGAQGAVFLGKLHGQEVAVKKVRNIKETDIKHLRKLKHPNIITFKSVGIRPLHPDRFIQ